MPLPSAMFADIGALEFGMLLGAYLTGKLLFWLLRRIIILWLNLIYFACLLLSSLASDIV